MARKYSNEAYVNFKTYFGSRAKYEGSYKDDFMINYNSSSEDEEFLNALANEELIGEVITVFTGGTYKEVGKIAVIYEHTLIEMFWNNVGKEHSYNRYANGKFSNIGRKATEKEIENKRIAQLERYENPKEHEKISNGNKKRYEDPKEHEKSSNAQNKRYEDPKEHEKQRRGQLKRFEDPKEHEKLSNGNKKRFENPEEKEKVRKKLLNRPDLSKIVLQYTLDGEFITEWPSIAEAQRKYGRIHIVDVCKGKRPYAGGYIWKFKE